MYLLYRYSNEVRSNAFHSNGAHSNAGFRMKAAERFFAAWPDGPAGAGRGMSGHSTQNDTRSSAKSGRGAVHPALAAACTLRYKVARAPADARHRGFGTGAHL